MLQRTTQTLALLGVLVAILLGLGRHWEFWSVVKRATVAYLVIYGTCGLLLALGRMAVDAEPRESSDGSGPVGERSGTSGTDAAS